MASSPEVVTFSRRRKGENRRKEENDVENEYGLHVGGTKSGVTYDVAEPLQKEDRGAKIKPGMWRRKGRRNRNKGLSTGNFISMIKAQFAEIDSFELLIETPSPVLVEQHHYGRQPLKDYNSGLLGEQDLVQRESPLRIRIDESQRSVLHTLPEHETELGQPHTGPRLSHRISNSHNRSSLLGRVSIGVHDALSWLNKRGSLTVTGRKASSSLQREIRNGDRLDFETDTLLGSMTADTKNANHSQATPKTNKKTSESQENIFTITEEEDAAVDEDLKQILNDIQHGTDTSLGTMFDSKLTIIDGPPETPATPSFETLTAVEQLLALCGQPTNIESTVSMDGLLGQHVNLDLVKKIGEGTFGEAFRADNIVFKIVPMEGTVLVNGEAQKRADEILAEVAITLTLSKLRDPNRPDHRDGKKPSDNVTTSFVETHGVGVCRGRYADALIKEWHRWDDVHGSENDSVDTFGNDQMYVVFVVSNGGIDLEHFEPQSFDEIRSIMMQVTLALAVAEEACEFEHRDLHWGNILISRDGTKEVQYTLRGVDVTVQAAGLKVTLIDFTLSRLLTQEGEVAFCDLNLDPEIFNGPKGDAQADTYRHMKKAVKNAWSSYVPTTNALWLDYLSDIMLTEKLPQATKRGDRSSLQAFKKDAGRATSASQLVWHTIFSGMWAV